ncbi:MAG: substrate-binding domain-containing protein [Candidatus Humimicrobiaceae bacterium]
MKKILLSSLILLICISMLATFSLIGCKTTATTTTAAAETTASAQTTKAAETTTTVAAETTAAKKYQIGYVSRLAVPWWIIADEGFKASGAKYNFKPVIYDPPKLTVEDQVRVLQTWTSSKLDGIFFAPNDPAAPIDAINAAIDAGIPVLCGYGVDSPDSKRLLFIGYDPYNLGVALGKGLLTLLKNAGKNPPGKVTYHTGGMASTEDTASWDGFRKTVEAAGYTAVEPLLDGGDAAKAISQASQAIAIYPDLVGMLGYYDYTGPALGKAVTDAGKIGKIVVQGDGFIGEDIPYMESGAMGATVDLVQYDGSYKAGEILYKLAQAGKDNWDKVLKEYKPDYPNDKKIMMNVGWITYKKLDVQPWPEISWIKTVDEYKNDYPPVWKIIGGK